MLKNALKYRWLRWTTATSITALSFFVSFRTTPLPSNPPSSNERKPITWIQPTPSQAENNNHLDSHSHPIQPVRHSSLPDVAPSFLEQNEQPFDSILAHTGVFFEQNRGSVYNKGQPQGLKPPTLSQSITPCYPPQAKRDGIEGFVDLLLNISPYGKVSSVHIIQSYPNKIFVECAAQAARKFQFEPALNLEGKAIEAEVKQRVRFSIR